MKGADHYLYTQTPHVRMEMIVPATSVEPTKMPCSLSWSRIQSAHSTHAQINLRQLRGSLLCITEDAVS